MMGFDATQQGPATHALSHQARRLDCRGALCAFHYSLPDDTLNSTVMRKCEDFFQKLEVTRVVLTEMEARFNDPEAEPKGPLAICDTAALELRVKERWTSLQALDCPPVSGEVIFSAIGVMPHRFSLQRNSSFIVVVSEVNGGVGGGEEHHGQEIAGWTSLQDSSFLREGSIDEEVIWLAVEALVGGVAFAHALGHSYDGSLTMRDVAVRPSRLMDGALEFALPPPFSIFSNGAPPQLSQIQAADVLGVAQVLSSLASASVPKQRYSAELMFLIKKMTSPAETRPTASQIMEFQAVKLRVKRRMLAIVAQIARVHWRMQRRQLQAQVEMLKNRTSNGPTRDNVRYAVADNSSILPSQSDSISIRERTLEERESKLQRFLELYEITTQTLDDLSINDRSVSGLKGLLKAMATPQPAASHTLPDVTLAAPFALKETVLHASEGASRHLVGLAPSSKRQASPSGTLPATAVNAALRPTTPPCTNAATTLGGLNTPPARSVPRADLPSPLPNIELSVNADTPPEALKRFVGGQSPCVHPPPPQLLNDSCDIEVIELDTSVDDRTKLKQQEDVIHRPSAQPRSTRRHHQGGVETSGSIEDSCTAWMDHHVAELDLMQQELHRSRVTPPKHISVSSSRRSPSTNRSQGANRSRGSGSNATSVGSDDPLAVLKKLRETITV